MLEKIREAICNCVDVDPEEITADSRLMSDLGLCSLDLAMLSLEIENEFGVSISPKTFAATKTVGGIMEYISKEKK